MVSPARFVPAIFVVLWATGFIGARYAMPYAEPFTFLTARFAITLIVFAPLVAIWSERRLSARQALNAMIAGVMMHGIYLGGVFWAIDHGMPAGLAALIVGLQPLVTAILAGVFVGEAVLPRHWGGLAIGFAGVVMVLSPRLGDAAQAVPIAALAACIVAVIGMSAGTVWQKRFLTRVDLVAGTMWQYVGGAVVAATFSLLFETRRFTLTGELVFAMAWLVLVLSVGAVVLLMYLIRDGAVSKVASLFYLVPAVTAVIAWFLFDETLSLFQIAGMAVTALGVAMATAHKRA